MRVQPSRPLLYEINTCCWLAELSRRCGATITLDQVPEAEFLSWKKRGFTHIWLMGVWTSGPRAAEIARSQPSLKEWAATIGHRPLIAPDSTLPLISASPYAVASYQVPPEYGGEDSLEIFRRKLNAAGLKLVLDFVPNHTGIDHPWLKERPELFVRTNEEREGTFAVESGGNLNFIAHGRDPYFLPWIDTAQLDYRKQATHNAMSDALVSVAERCDGVRCDMAMLVLREVFQRTWENFPTDAAAQDEFWPGAIRRVKERFPGFMFLAEAYWDLEPILIDMGLDCAYDKVLYDRLVRGDPREICAHIYSQPARQLEHSAHFIENHDEQRAAGLMSLERHRVAAALILSLPGIPFLHEGQLVGAKERVPVQATARPAEPTDSNVQAMYDELLKAIGRSDVGKGDWKLVTFEPGNSPVVGIHWTETFTSASPAGALLSPGTLAVVNLAQAAVGVSLPQAISGAGWSLLGQVEGASLSMSATGPAKLSIPACGWVLLQIAQA